MRTYLVETYLSRARADELDSTVARLRAAVQAKARTGEIVRYLRSTFVPEDEICFHVLESLSLEVVAEVSAEAAIRPERIVEAKEELRWGE
jgi:hypothetical protein